MVDGRGDDTLDGGLGRARATWSASPNGVTVHLGAGTASGQGDDSLFGVEDATGSDHDDLLTGTSGPNLLDGSGGVDLCVGRGGADSFDRCEA